MPAYTIPAQLIGESDFVLVIMPGAVRPGAIPRLTWLYAFGREGEAPLFTGSDFECPLWAKEERIKLEILAFLTLRDGDTDDEYFNRYSPSQLEWAKSYSCEALAAWVSAEEERARA